MAAVLIVVQSCYIAWKPSRKRFTRRIFISFIQIIISLLLLYLTFVYFIMFTIILLDALLYSGFITVTEV